MSTQPQPYTLLESFDNRTLERDYTVQFTLPEFTCLCPRTGQPDFATLELEYVPDRLCIELKALKVYLWSFRDRGAFHEAVTNEIIEHLAATISPRFMRLSARFNVRGGICTSVIAERRSPQWQPGQAVHLSRLA